MGGDLATEAGVIEGPGARRRVCGDQRDQGPPLPRVGPSGWLGEPSRPDEPRPQALNKGLPVLGGPGGGVEQEVRPPSDSASGTADGVRKVCDVRSTAFIRFGHRDPRRLGFPSSLRDVCKAVKAWPEHTLAQSQPDPELLTYTQAAEFLGLIVGALYAKVHRKEIPRVRLGTRLVRFDKAELIRWVESGRVAVIEGESSSDGRRPP